jgi:hypothetical protein
VLLPGRPEIRGLHTHDGSHVQIRSSYSEPASWGRVAKANPIAQVVANVISPLVLPIPYPSEDRVITVEVISPAAAVRILDLRIEEVGRHWGETSTSEPLTCALKKMRSRKVFI